MTGDVVKIADGDILTLWRDPEPIPLLPAQITDKQEKGNVKNKTANKLILATSGKHTMLLGQTKMGKSLSGPRGNGKSLTLSEILQKMKDHQDQNTEPPTSKRTRE